jgi:hypothetical protein
MGKPRRGRVQGKYWTKPARKRVKFCPGGLLERVLKGEKIVLREPSEDIEEFYTLYED